MTNVWEKLNLKEGQDVAVLNAPKSFAAALKAVPGHRVHERVSAIKKPTFVLAFAEKKSQLDS
jgi:hypothetical protein